MPSGAWTSGLTAFVGRENARAVEAFDREEPGSPATLAYGPLARRRFEVSPQVSTGADCRSRSWWQRWTAPAIFSRQRHNLRISRCSLRRTPERSRRQSRSAPKPPPRPSWPRRQRSPPPLPAAKPEDTQALLNRNEFLQRSQNLAIQQNAFVPPPRVEEALHPPDPVILNPVPT